MTIDALIGAIRAADGGDAAGAADAAAAELATATRLRVMRSLEARARGRHQLIAFATAAAILLGGTVSWALATGEIAALWRPMPPAPSVAPRPPRRPAVAPPRQPPAISVDPRPAQAAEPAPPEAAPPPPSPRPAVSPPPRRAAPAVEVLYRRAHELHFHGSDPIAALAAWDAYLAAEPDGRFAVEAGYNRALMLARLGRYAEARAALMPYARGEVVPVGYRQAEAEQLVERLARYDGSR